MKKESIQESLRQFWLTQCEKPVAGSRFKEAYAAVKDFIDERKNGKTAVPGAGESTGPGG